MSDTQSTLLQKLELDVLSAAGVRNGKQYLNSLQDSREVWLDGEKVDVTTHPAFAEVLSEMCRLYDLQNSPEHCELMTFASPYSGKPISRSYQLPDSREALQAKWKNTHFWMKETWGQMARLPDFMANVVVGLYDYREELARINPMFGQNVLSYYRYCSENDLCLTHAIGDPQIDRSASPEEDPDLALRIVERRSDGVVVRGAKQLATLAPLAHETLVYMSPSFARRNNSDFVLWAGVPLAAKGLKIICREPHGLNTSGYALPFAKYDEQDALLIFDDVFIPNERIFLMDEPDVAFEGFSRINAWALYCGQIRAYYRLELFYTVATLLSEAIGIENFRNCQDMMGELAAYTEIVRLTNKGIESEVRRTPGGLFAPGDTTAAGVFSSQITPRVTQIIKELASSGLIMQPSENDLSHPELRPLLDRYMRGKNIDSVEKSRLFRLAWNLTGDRFGSRQELYERLHRGNLTRNRTLLHRSLDIQECRERLLEMLKEEGDN